MTNLDDYVSFDTKELFVNEMQPATDYYAMLRKEWINNEYARKYRLPIDIVLDELLMVKHPWNMALKEAELLDTASVFHKIVGGDVTKVYTRFLCLATCPDEIINSDYTITDMDSFWHDTNSYYRFMIDTTDVRSNYDFFIIDKLRNIVKRIKLGDTDTKLTVRFPYPFSNEDIHLT